jgi:hypothetical protein
MSCLNLLVSASPLRAEAPRQTSAFRFASARRTSRGPAIPVHFFGSARFPLVFVRRGAAVTP